MKRPEGFDRPEGSDRAQGSARPEAPGRPAERSDPLRGRTATLERRAGRGRGMRLSGESASPEMARAASVGPARVRSAKAELRTAARARRRAERAEVRRFTRRTRRRRIAAATAGSLAFLLTVMVVAAVYSPLLALRRISVEGTVRLNATQLHDAVDGQLGTPLALLDEKRITGELGAFPLIRSYSTEIVPPDTLLIRVVERQPVAALASGAGFELVDPAGVSVASSQGRPAGVPVITLPPSQGVNGVAFTAMTRVLLSLPPDLLSRVDTVTARTADDVAFTVTGSGQIVEWGSADDAATKAQTLTRMPQWVAGQAGTYDVASSGAAIFTGS